MSNIIEFQTWRPIGRIRPPAELYIYSNDESGEYHLHEMSHSHDSGYLHGIYGTRRNAIEAGISVAVREGLNFPAEGIQHD